MTARPDPAHLSILPVCAFGAGASFGLFPPPEGRTGGAAAYCGGSNFVVRVIPAARPFAEITSAIFREASSIIYSPCITAPLAPPFSEVKCS